jgi:hypothetical protein
VVVLVMVLLLLGEKVDIEEGVNPWEEDIITALTKAANVTHFCWEMNFNMVQRCISSLMMKGS